MFERLAAVLFPSACCGCSVPGTVLCAECRPRPAAIRTLRYDALRVTAAGAYAGTLRRAVLALKHGRHDAAAVLGALLAERAERRISPGTLIVPVPTTARRRRERGFDQAVRLAEACGERSGAGVLVALEQRRGDAQRGRSRAARLRARGRFACTVPELVRGAQVVLVDDVVTTGATLLDCALTLQECGAFVREAIVIAYA